MAVAWLVYLAYHAFHCYAAMSASFVSEISPFAQAFPVWFGLEISACVILVYNTVADIFCVPANPRSAHRGSRGTGFLVYLWTALFVGFNVAFFVLLALSPNKRRAIWLRADLVLAITFQFFTAVVIAAIALLYVVLALSATAVLNKRARKAARRRRKHVKINA